MTSTKPSITLRQEPDGTYTAACETSSYNGKDAYVVLAKLVVAREIISVSFGAGDRTVLKDTELDGPQIAILADIQRAMNKMGADAEPQELSEGLSQLDEACMHWNMTYPNVLPELP